MRRNALANRERILAAAEEVFGEEGGAGSTEEVARRANVGIATVFRHFPTKDALVEAALVRHFAVLEEQATKLTGTDDAGAALQQLITTMIETAATKLTLAAQVGDPPPSIVEAAARLRGRMSTILERAQAQKTVDPDVTVDEVYVLIRGLSQAGAAMTIPPETMARATAIVQRGLAPRV